MKVRVLMSKVKSKNWRVKLRFFLVVKMDVMIEVVDELVVDFKGEENLDGSDVEENIFVRIMVCCCGWLWFIVFCINGYEI